MVNFGEAVLLIFLYQVPDMGLVCGSRLRRWKLVNTANISVNFAEK